ncbi:hypothetical protein HWV23_14800 [Natronomonas halophila]|uniref:hypothetical protein n=1 Tax=Natronomonas halophila TaxID=2747817 RepID=UPI0015B3874D|nr:hypothetical protein [Natronomonas halophila]QLD86942.1 hypothetical protein HWV23_14800 [Natronomonas halophila]
MSRDRTRTDERSGGDVTADLDVGLDEESDAGQSSETRSSGIRGRVGSRATSVFSPRMFVAAFLLSVFGVFVASTFVPVPGSGLLGVFLATFVFGLVVSERRYVEATAAGGIAMAGSAVFDVAVIAFLGGFGLPLALLGGAAGAVVGLVGNYFGRDLRHGLTRDIE